MSLPREPFWGWPGWRHLGLAALLGLAVSVWFELIYGGADLLTALQTRRIRVHLDAELDVPFVPASVLGYMSLYPLFWAAPFILRRRRELKALAATLAAVTLVAGVCFLLLPVEVAFPEPPEDMGPWTELVLFAKGLALRNNLLPSLHVALAVVCVGVFAGRAGFMGNVLLWAWALAIGVSTMLLHQHYLADVVTGFALGLAGIRWGYWRWAVPETLAETPPPSPAADRGPPA